jgi:hypothetical protein
LDEGLGIPGRVAVVVLVVGLLLAGYAGVRYFRLQALDDYRTGYAVGTVASQDAQRGTYCMVAMERLYAGESSGWSARPAGWGEFLAGCEDAVRGEQAATWYQVRDRLWGSGGAD